MDGFALDLATLHWVLFGTQGATGAVLVYMLRAHPDERAIRYWACGAVFTMLAGLLMALRTPDNGLFTVVLANALVIAAVSCSWMGVRSYLKMPQPWGLVCAALLVQLMISSWHGLIEPTVWLHVAVIGSLMSLLSMGIVFDIVRSPMARAMASCRIVLVLHLLFSLTYATMAAIMLIERPPGATIPGSVTAPLSVFVSILCSFVCTMGYVLMLSERLQLALNTQAITDSLTGLLNRRAFTTQSLAEIARAVRDMRTTGLLIVDIDRFKSINDRFGHLAGDHVLVGVARSLEQTVRQGDILARMGGEEFAVLLPATDLGEALQVAGRLRSAIESLALSVSNEVLQITISVGATVIMPHDDLDRALARADEALYAAKNAGRNRVDVITKHDDIASREGLEWSPAPAR
jgi:diguanylate cyclase (GGDEF)-like protein